MQPPYGIHIHLALTALQLLVYLFTWFGLWRFHFFDKFSKLAILTYLIPETVLSLLKVGLVIGFQSADFGFEVWLIQYSLRLFASQCVVVALVFMFASYRDHVLLKSKPRLRWRIKLAIFLVVNASMTIVLTIFASDQTISSINISHVIKLVVLFILAALILFKTVRHRPMYISRRHGPSALVTISMLKKLLLWVFIVQLLTIEYLIFVDPKSIGIPRTNCTVTAIKTFISTPIPTDCNEPQYGVISWIVQELRPILCSFGIWAWQPAFRFEMEHVFRGPPPKTPGQTMTVSLEPPPVPQPETDGAEGGQSIDYDPKSIEPDERSGPMMPPRASSLGAVAAKGPFARIQRVQRMETDYMSNNSYQTPRF